MKCPCITFTVTCVSFISKFVAYKSVNYVLLICLLYVTFSCHISGVSTIRKGVVLYFHWFFTPLTSCHVLFRLIRSVHASN